MDAVVLLELLLLLVWLLGTAVGAAAGVTAAGMAAAGSLVGSGGRPAGQGVAEVATRGGVERRVRPQQVHLGLQ